MIRLRQSLAALLLPLAVSATEISLPTGNDALLRGRPADFYQPTIEGTVESGKFGCVRRGGARFHEGVDIKCLHRDRRGEATDPVLAAADGTVAFVNSRPGLSNYGRYIILVHRWDGVEVHTLYAHLAAIADGLRVNQPVRRAQTIGTLGRSTNTREGIPPERAHLHFEVNFLLNPHFDRWHRAREPKAPPFGAYNGQNFFGLDPTPLLQAAAGNKKFNFAEYVARQPIAFTVLISARPFPWLTAHPEQVQRKVAGKDAPVAYEVGATAWGAPIAVWPRGAGELTDAQRALLQRGRPVVARVNQTVLAQHGCRSLVEPAARGWQLTPKGHDWVELLTFVPGGVR
jgi:hypothetical protein